MRAQDSAKEPLCTYVYHDVGARCPSARVRSSVGVDARLAHVEPRPKDPEHRDDGSLLTLSVLLSDPSDFTGGAFFTWSPAAEVDCAMGGSTGVGVGRGEGVRNCRDIELYVRDV